MAGDEAATIRSEAMAWTSNEAALDALVDLVGDAHVVLLGGASHGTHEFYANRARITERLITEKRFCAVAVEADWPGTARVNRYVRGRSADATAEEALRGFKRFPSWMWRNAVVIDFVDWLRGWNDRLGDDERTKTGFYGLDLYSLFRSTAEVIRYLERVDPDAARRARERYSCFDYYDEDAQAYGAAFEAGDSCQSDAAAQLMDLERFALEHSRRQGLVADDELFDAVQNARTVANAERYYRTMFGSRVATWNLRARHMAETLDGLASHLSRQRGEPARLVVWAHNSHVGDARATDQGLWEINLGQLVRERHLGDCMLVGFTTYTGTVTAADSWGGPAGCKPLRPAAPGSVEELFHRTGEGALLIPFAKAPATTELLRQVRLERAIGVVYRPDREERSHYLRARLAKQFDAVVHFDETRAVEPLDRTAPGRAELAATYPFGV